MPEAVVIFIGKSCNQIQMLMDISKAMESGQYCIDAVVAVVNKENTDVTSLTQAQLKSIFTGETLKWEDIK